MSCASAASSSLRRVVDVRRECVRDHRTDTRHLHQSLTHRAALREALDLGIERRDLLAQMHEGAEQDVDRERQREALVLRDAPNSVRERWDVRDLLPRSGGCSRVQIHLKEHDLLEFARVLSDLLGCLRQKSSATSTSASTE